MFREMRRTKQLLSHERCIEILQKGKSGVLAVDGDDDYPYAVPLSYVYHDSKIYFHCAKNGHKLDAIRKNPKVSFCVVEQDLIVPAEFTSYFISVIAFGKACLIEDDTKKREAIHTLMMKYSPLETEENIRKGIEKDFSPLCIVEMTIEHLTGKEAIELVK